MALPALTGWDVHVRYFPPLHAEWDPRTGMGTLPSLLVGALAVWQAVGLAERLPWRTLLLSSYAGGVAWLFSLALVDGPGKGIGTILGDEYEYLRTARATSDLPAALREWVSRIPYDGLPDDIPHANWPVHVAGHPPGALSFFVLLDRVGLGGGLQAGIVVTLVAASTAVAVLVTLRVLGAEVAARRAAPFLVFGPAAIWQCVSADAMFAAFAAWGIAALAAAAVRRSTGWALVAGLLLGYAVMLSYGLPLLGLLAVAVLVVARNWRPLPWAVLGALAVVGTYAALGFNYLEALPALHDRYWAGVARNRPKEYWMWGNLAALAFSAGPLVGAGLTTLGRRARDLDIDPDAVRVVRWLVVAAVLMVLSADLSQMSKAEVERIWLPFVPWLLVSCSLLPQRWRRVGLGVQVLVALVVQHLLFTGW
ncbi:MAG: hypothetical protein JWR90_2350 [Marmoricola sp.]|jgi:hypothetical protein|nr:hypothetical protein [Marmoricola sp.]